MIGCLRKRIAIVLATVVAGIGLHVQAARAVVVGDCSANGQVSIGEVQKCANIFSGANRCICPACDRNGNGPVSIGEVQGAANCFSNPASCQQVTPGPACITPGAATPTPTIVPATSIPTLPPPTSTPTATATNTPGEGPLPNVCGNGIPEAAIGETCDNGGTCIDGPKFCKEGPHLGQPCTIDTADIDCGLNAATGEINQCFGNACTKDADCDGGVCKAFGGDGCSALCTAESDFLFKFSGAKCYGPLYPKASPPVDCTFQRTCVGGAFPGKVCASGQDCGPSNNRGVCTSECGTSPNDCLGVGGCTSGDPAKTGNLNANPPIFPTECASPSGVSQPNFCAGGANDLLPCNPNSQCPSGACGGTGGVPNRCSNNATRSCTTNANCLSGGTCTAFACVGGTAPANTVCNRNFDCPTGVCGNYCGVNGSTCTTVSTPPCPAGTQPGVCTAKSAAVLQSLTIGALSIGPLAGQQVLKVGKPNLVANDGVVPVCAKAQSVFFTPVKVPGLACACVRGAFAPDVAGPGNSSAGLIGCGATGVTGINVNLSRDHNTTPPKQCIGGTSDGAVCNPDVQCPGGGTCSLTTFTCTGGTNNGLGCNPSVDCPNGACNTNNGPGTCQGGSVREGLACGSTFDCGGGSGTDFCKNIGKGGGVCVAGANLGKACKSNADCGVNGLCDSPDDPMCSAHDAGRTDLRSFACKESSDHCIGGPTPDKKCMTDDQCSVGDNLGVCGNECNNLSRHPGTCNSPDHASTTGVGTIGDGIVVTSTAIGVMMDAGTCGLAATCTGTGFPAQPQACTTGAACAVGTPCIAGACLKPCTVNSECSNGGLCKPGFCAGVCTGDLGTAGMTCVTNLICTGAGAGVCALGGSFGNACTADTDCPSGKCQLVFPAKGADGLPCTPDDPIGPGRPATGLPIPTTTSMASATLVDANDTVGVLISEGVCTPGTSCVGLAQGTKFNCSSLLNGGPLTNTKLVAAFDNIDQALVGDNVVTNSLTSR